MGIGGENNIEKTRRARRRRARARWRRRRAVLGAHDERLVARPQPDALGVRREALFPTKVSLDGRDEGVQVHPGEE